MMVWSAGRPAAGWYWSAAAKFTSLGLAGYLGIEIGMVVFASLLAKRLQSQEIEDVELDGENASGNRASPVIVSNGK